MLTELNYIYMAFFSMSSMNVLHDMLTFVCVSLDFLSGQCKGQTYIISLMWASV